MSDLLLSVQNAICQKVFDLTGVMIVNTDDMLARAAIEAMRDHTLVYQQYGAAVHELRGDPDDIWKALLDKALT